VNDAVEDRQAQSLQEQFKRPSINLLTVTGRKHNVVQEAFAQTSVMMMMMMMMMPTTTTKEHKQKATMTTATTKSSSYVTEFMMKWRFSAHRSWAAAEPAAGSS
jgi:hypothetical protein